MRHRVLLVLAGGCWPLLGAQVQNALSARNQVQAVETAPTTNNLFLFPGGSLDSFIQQIDERWHVDVRSRATIAVPGATLIPKMRTSAANPLDPLVTYNLLSGNGFPEIGHWFWTGKVTDLPEVLALAAPPTNVSPVRIRAFSVRYLTDQERTALEDAVREAWRVLEFSGGEVPRTTGRPGLQFNPATQLLLINGSAPFLDAAEAVVTEYRRWLPNQMYRATGRSEAPKP